jgi:hypothetical protein
VARRPLAVPRRRRRWDDLYEAQGDQTKDAAHCSDGAVRILRLHVQALALLRHLAVDAIDLQTLTHVSPQLAQEVGPVVAL